MAWFVFWLAWSLALWRWSLTITAALLLRATLLVRPGRPVSLSEWEAAIEPLPHGLSWPSDLRGRITSETVPRRNTLSPRKAVDRSGAPDAVVWEAERRIILGGFSMEYLLEGLDLPQWTDESGAPSAGPCASVWEDGRWQRYQWKVVVNEETDENG
eukprot:CAMPEP_0170635466 /NCGR_PEP_ID=MMETSP0224-20130122/37230_1 /TAXON_ID=285029 /ORGANISM="Togula jolla, Strain CCCM 725" /LENGTH=156 /DNA_ID=CAMNT_0010964955 /DNA_START=29 /DNA_END=496 /DNA_ORIENTATION=-